MSRAYHSAEGTIMKTEELQQAQPPKKSSDYVLKLRLSQVLTTEDVHLLRAFLKNVKLTDGTRGEADH